MPLERHNTLLNITDFSGDLGYQGPSYCTPKNVLVGEELNVTLLLHIELMATEITKIGGVPSYKHTLLRLLSSNGEFPNLAHKKGLA